MEKKEPMIGRENRPTAIDYDAPISNFRFRPDFIDQLAERILWIMLERGLVKK
jgi:hypothetical protein